DSNVNLNPFEEIRLLDYGQRLTSRSRNTFGETGSRYAIESVFDAGGRATGVSGDNFFEVGKPFNGCVVGSDHPLVSETSMSNRLNTIVYCSDPTLQRGSIVNGRASVAGELNNEIGDRFAKVLRELGNR
ncbi:MAG: formimidoylglutamate deiminase, partial [Acidobacteriota bacterium]|nr:formimidoylglutamate deiminase [Acidobacteriota bacterium]